MVFYQWIGPDFIVESCG